MTFSSIARNLTTKVGILKVLRLIALKVIHDKFTLLTVDLKTFAFKINENAFCLHVAKCDAAFSWANLLKLDASRYL